MKQITTLLAAALICLSAAAQTPKNAVYTFTEASDLNLINKMMPDTPNPYARVDTLVWKGFSKGENYQVRCGSGMAVAFKTNATSISVKTQYSDEGNKYETLSTTATSYRGYDLYIKKGGKWVYAASGAVTRNHRDDNCVLIKDMDGSEHECIMYLPEYAEVYSVQVGVEEGASISALKNPFKGRVVVHGSSFTQGVSTSRSGMAYSAQMERHTGLQMINFGCSGNCKMQPYFCDVLCAVEADAYVFDAFSNPSAEMIQDRLVGFIDRLVEAHPGKPLIFQETIYRERRNFNVENEKFEAAKNEVARKIFAELKKDEKYKDVYLITTNATSPLHETSVDGTHPDDYGYYLWARSIEPQITEILANYGLVTGAIAKQRIQETNYRFTEAYELNLIGKMMEGTPNPYARVDTCKYKGFTVAENRQVRCPTGLAVLFKTNSKAISVKTKFGWEYSSVATMPIAYRGYDLYIKKDGKWLWAASGAVKPEKNGENLVLIQGMDGSEHECMLYMPNYSEVYSCLIGTDKDSSLEALESPFRNRIVFHGSSYTHGVSTSRAGMSYPMQFMRSTGMQVLSFGMSGNCKMQPYCAAVLEDVEADAYVFDSFSNPDAKMIRERLIPFIDRLVAAHPDKPLIFQQTIRREARNFSVSYDDREQAKMDMAAKIFREEVFSKENKDKYKDVYFITPNASDGSHEYSVDGVHPDDYGYHLWEQSIEKQILKILKKYGIK